MSDQAGNLKRKKESRRRNRIWNFLRPFVVGYIRHNFSFECGDFEPADIDGPVLVAANHSCAYDPLLVGVAFRNKQLIFIASEHLMRVRFLGSFFDKTGFIIPHSKGSKANRTALAAMKRMKRGESVFLAVEGEQTWDGLSLPVKPFTGKLVKASGATLVTYRLEGAYLSTPRWAMHKRKGKIFGHPVNIYTPEMLKEMSNEEVESAIAEDLWLDTWEWQKSLPGGPIQYKCKKGNAEGLERAVFTCPECGKTGNLKSKADYIACDCGFKLRLEDSGFFTPPQPFETIADWDAYDRKILEEKMSAILENGAGSADIRSSEIRSGAVGRELFADSGVSISKIGDDHQIEWAEAGNLSLEYRDGQFVLCACGHGFSIKGIKDMTMILAARIVFSDKSGYYEIRSDKKSKINLRKYVIAWEIGRNS